MESPLPLVVWYVGLQAAAVLALTVTGYWVWARTDGRHRAVFTAYIGLQCAWLLVAMSKLLVQLPTAKYVLSLTANVIALLGVAVLGYFATVYTNRSPSPRKPRNAAFVVLFVVGLLGIVTDPWLGLQYASVSYQADPIAYLAIRPGPVYGLNTLTAVGVLVVSIAYLAGLFLSSPHRPSSSLALLGLAAVLSVLPNAVSALTTVPLLPGYDYTVFGIAPLTVVLAYVVFFRGELDLAPTARAALVDEIDDALFGLDDAGRVIDYNAAARRLLPDAVETPVGRPLADLAPELAAELRLPAEPGEDVVTTYSTVVDGARTHYSASVSPIAERGTVAGYTVVLRDVTAVESATRELERQNEQLESFATTVTHDLRNPLQVASGTTALLTEELRSDDDAPEAALDHLGGVEAAISRMDDRLEELQTLAEHAQSVTETETLAFEAAVRAAWDRSDTEGMELSIEAGGTIAAEPTRLDSILESLIRHGSADDGCRVSVALTDDGFTFETDGRRVGAAEGVFEYGTVTDTGLGLKIVRTQAESQGWTVDVAETTDGTRFVVTGAVTEPEPTDAVEEPQ